MDANDDQTTLRLRVVYEANEAITKAISEIRQLKEQTGGLSAENQKTLVQLEYQKTLLDGAGSSLDHYTELVHEEALAQRAIRQALEESEPAHASLATTVESTASAHGKMGRGVLQASYAVQDFTSVLSGGGGLSRALGSVQNNIPVLLTGLGVGAGLAGTISLVSVGLGAVIPLLGAFADGQDKAAEATAKHAEEAEKLKNTLTTEEEQVKKAVDSYTKDANNKVVAQAIETALVLEAKKKEVTTEDIEQAMAETPGMGSEQAALIVKGDRVKRAREDANRLFSTLSTDPSSRAEAARLADSHGGFPADFAGAMRAPLTATPEALFNQGVDDYDEALAAAEESSKRKKERDKQADALTRQGLDLQEKTFRERDKAQEDQDKLSDQLTREGLHAQEKTFQEKEDREAKAAKDAERAAKDAARAATRAAHDADPRIANRRAMQQEQSQALNLVQQNTHGFDAPQQHEIARHLQNSYDAGLGLSHTFQQLLADAIRQSQEHYARGIQAGLRRQQQNSLSFYGN